MSMVWSCCGLCQPCKDGAYDYHWFIAVNNIYQSNMEPKLKKISAIDGELNIRNIHEVHFAMSLKYKILAIHLDFERFLYCLFI